MSAQQAELSKKTASGKIGSGFFLLELIITIITNGKLK